MSQNLTTTVKKQARDLTDLERIEFVKLLREGTPQGARDYADKLVQEGVMIEMINYSGYQVLVRHNVESRKRLEELAGLFKGYYWHCWLNLIKS